MRTTWIYAASAALWLMPAAQAQQPVYKCSGKGEITYSHVPCTGAQVLGAPTPKPAASRPQPVTSNRAKLHARGLLPPDVLKQCVELDGKLRDEQEVVKAKGAAVTPAEEGVLVRLRLKQKELGC